MQIVTKLGVYFSESLLPYERKMGLEKNPLMVFCVIAILRFFVEKTRPKLTNLRGEIIKGSTFKSDMM